MNEFLFWCRHPLVPFLFHVVTSLHPLSLQRNDFPLVLYYYSTLLSDKLCFFSPELDIIDFSSSFQVHYWLDDIHCDGDEESLLDCDHAALGDHNCADHEIAAVSCKKCFSLCSFKLISPCLGNETAIEPRAGLIVHGQSSPHGLKVIGMFLNRYLILIISHLQGGGGGGEYMKE